MRRFVKLYDVLDRTSSTNAKIEAMVEYFAEAPAVDAAWAVYFLSGSSLKSPVRVRTLAAWASQLAEVSDWMFEASYEAVGDLAETIALLVDAIPYRDVSERWDPGLAEVVTWIKTLHPQSEGDQREQMVDVWQRLERADLFMLTKLLTGSLRVGVSKRLVVRALSAWSGIEPPVVSHRLMGHWQPTAEGFLGLFDEDASDADRSRPYPYFLASPLDGEPAALGAPDEWQAEWKWDGIRGQLIRRGGETYLWSRGEELVTAQYPEIAEAAKALPDGVVLDGEILAWKDGAPLPFAAMQRRIGRKRIGKKILAEAPVVFMTYDQMEADGEDLREKPLIQRRAVLEETLAGTPTTLLLSEIVGFNDWSDLADTRDSSRERGVEGLMLKRTDSPYRVGRTRGDWWKWKTDPFEVDAVLIYAQPGHGRRASLYTDYTFAVWADGELVPIAKAYSGLSNEEIRELDQWIRRHTLEKFGPVRAVEPEHVFELHFENVASSKRHKSGIAVRFPRIARWKKALRPDEADNIEVLRQMIRPTQGPGP